MSCGNLGYNVMIMKLGFYKKRLKFETEEEYKNIKRPNFQILLLKFRYFDEENNPSIICYSESQST